MAVLSNIIYIGSIKTPLYKYTNASIKLGSAHGEFSVDILGNELTIDQFYATVEYDPSAPLAYSPAGTTKGYITTNTPEIPGNKVMYLVKKSADNGTTYLHRATWGTPVWWYVGGKVFAKGYMSKAERIGKTLYRITCMSGIGLLENKMHTGGLYNRTAASTILSSIIGGLFSYTVADDVKDVEVNGWLPYDTARNNLHRLLFALGAAMTKKSNGDYLIEFLDTNPGNVIKVPSDRVMMGGRVEYTVPIDGVEVTEHAFFATNNDEEVTLYDTAGTYVDNLTVVFDNAPVHNLAATSGLTIVTSHVNYAIITGTGQLTGKAYTHTIRTVTAGGGTNNIRKVENNCLVSYANSYAIARRVYQYFTTAKRIESKLLLDWVQNNEVISVSPGKQLSLLDGYGDPTTAYLSAMDVLVTTLKGANCKFVAGFVPGGGGNNFTHREIITKNKTWRVPNGITLIRAVLISGGNGGSGGYDGQPGAGGLIHMVSNPSQQLQYKYEEDYGDVRHSRYGSFYWTSGRQATAYGGNAGTPGSSGRILIADITVVGGASCTCVVGKGGAGGEPNGGIGDPGGDTSFRVGTGTAYTTVGADTNEYGFYDAFADLLLATPGEAGYKGGNGGKAGTKPDYIGNDGVDGGKGGNVGSFKGGTGGNGLVLEQQLSTKAFPRFIKATGGCGGGAAWGANGGAGEDPTSFDVETSNGKVTAGSFSSGKPGNGANAAKPEKPVYGCGGTAGNGGGAGGNMSGIQAFNVHEELTDWFSPWAQIGIAHGDNYRYTDEFKDHDCGGTGGKGSYGGNGGDGCIIVYY